MEIVSKKFGLIRAEQDSNGQIWFVAKDVCEALGYNDVDSAVRKLDEDEKLNRKIYVSGQNREMTTINESGLYTLILRSNKPEAKPFRKWVTSEVLPSLRKYGTYSVPQTIDLKQYLEEPALIWHENVLCVRVGWMLENNIITKDAWGALANRGKVWRVRKGGNGRGALVALQSLPLKYRLRVTELVEKEKEVKKLK